MGDYPGMGAMLHYLGGGSPHAPSEYVGRTIVAATEGDDAVCLILCDSAGTNTKIRIHDNGQSCCEARYLRTDDNLSDLVGHTLTGIETNAAKTEGWSANTPDSGEYGDAHEAVFLDIKTDSGTVTFSFHNEHNGYYGGFGLSIDEG